MATIRCPQCGTEFEKGSLEFCPNPNCGYPVAFLDDTTVPQDPRPMERRPGEVAPTPIQPTPPPPPAAPKPPRNLRPLLFVAGGIAVIAIIVVGFLLLKGNGKKPVAGKTTAATSKPATQPATSKPATSAPTTAPTTPSQTTSATTPPKPPKGIQLTWVAADPQTDLRGTGAQSMNALAGSPKGKTLVAAGSTASLGENDAAVWHSDDGRTWTIVTGQDSLGGPGDQQVNGISPLPGGGFIVVGSDTSSGSQDAAVWRSADGDTWTKVSSDALGGPGKQSMNRVSETPLGLLGVGSTTNSADGTQDGAIWRSTDGGASWTLLPLGDLGGPGDQDVKRVTVLKSGITTGFVAVGTSTLNGDSDAAVWTSTDGQVWTRVPDPGNVLGGPGNQGMIDVQTFGTELVAGGFSAGTADIDGAVWTSSNGTDWTRVDSAQLGGDGDQVIDRILVTKPVEGSAVPAIVAGGTSTVNGDEDAAIWYSNDGTTWNRETSTGAALGGQNAQAINTIGQHGATLVAVGIDASAGDPNAGVWTAESPVAASPTP
ncbi:MAG TPA: hypothetical protein VNN79_01180 [Actinomycetota bacterium]|nr:hypothetical protein [Actinomycetota bacterium]